MPSDYPVVRRDDTIATAYGETVVPDPYRWLEMTESNDTAACAC